MPRKNETQRTPNEGYEIPLPTRSEIENALAKAAKPFVGDPNHPSTPPQKRKRKPRK